MATVEESNCPACKAPPGTLQLAARLQAQEVGDFSLAGVMTKFSAREVPVLTCAACPLELVGRYEGRHVTFSAPPA